jgi:adenine-specific DNA-methyltransferase
LTVDTSRVALALARQRIMGARFPYYMLSEAGWALQRLDITASLVTADGAVEIWEREN